MNRPQNEWPESSQASNEEWEKQADLWDGRMGDDGNDFHQELVSPSVDELLNPVEGDVVLDVGCGNGVYSRHLAQLGVSVMAIDVSPTMIDKAKQRTQEGERQITYKVMDATSNEHLASLSGDAYDAVVCNMTLMDLAQIRPLVETLPRILKAEGRFVFSIAHPCFNNSVGTSRVVEESYNQHGK